MQKAVALTYQKNQDNAPRVIASGRGLLAQNIITKAKDFNIPLFCNKNLVDSLLEIQINEEIPQILYDSVVEVFIWLSLLEKNAQVSTQP